MINKRKRGRYHSSEHYAIKQLDFIKKIGEQSIIFYNFFEKIKNEFFDMLGTVNQERKNIIFIYDTLRAQSLPPAPITQPSEEEQRIEDLQEKIENLEKEIQNLQEKNLRKKNIFQSFLEKIRIIFSSIKSIFSDSH